MPNSPSSPNSEPADAMTGNRARSPFPDDADEETVQIAAIPRALDGTTKDTPRLQQSDRATKFARVLGGATDGYWSVSSSGILTEVNAVHAAVLGYTPAQMIGTHVSRYSARNRTEEDVRANLAQIKALGTTRFETEHIHRLGHTVTIEAVAAYLPEYDETVALIRDISARKRAEAALQAEQREAAVANQKLRTMLESMSDGVMTLDLSCHVTEINDALCQMVGMERESMVGLDVSHLSVSGAQAADGLKALMAQGEAVRVERTFPHGDGHERTFDVTVTPLVEVGEVMVLVRDITAKKNAAQSERARRAERDQQAGRFHALTQATLDGFWLADPDGILREVNDGLCTMLGWSREELVGQHVMRITQIEDPVDRKRWAEQLRPGGHLRTEARFCRRDGGTIAVDLTVWVDPQDGAYLCIAHDITARQIMQEQQQALLDQREAQAAKFEALTNASLDGFIMVDQDNVIVEVNDAYLEKGGWQRHELRGTPITVVTAATEEFLHEKKKQMQKTPHLRFETHHRRSDGTLFPVDVSAMAMPSTGRCLLFVHDITERHAREEASRHAAFYDMLTDLPNRRMLIDAYRKTAALTARRQERGALIYLDLDNFKLLNDARGHDFGDEVLRQVGKRLRLCVRDCDTVARVGGDEFVLVLGELNPDPQIAGAQASVVAERVCRSLAKPYVMKDHVHTGGCSVGVAMFHDERDELDVVMKYADSAMYQAKKSGRNQARFFDSVMQARLTARSVQAREISDALARDQFLLHYQVQVGANQRPCGAEALVRWLHPDRGLLPPSEFIPVAEETGFIVLLDDWVLHTACRQLKAWQDHPDTKDLPLSVNVSAKQFNQADFEKRILTVLEETGAPAHLLKLELTETVALKNVEQTVAKMTALQAHGVKFSMDDFGTGYSSLTYLRRLPFDQLKIDQAFVQGLPTEPTSVAIVESILAMSRGLGIEVVAEGVETSAELEALRERGCTMYQGYLFSRPIPTKDYESLLRKG